ncbi:hypothetical protein Bpfe_001253 [Biomphalaria pfeifferi]|uniref:Uncharacterized protein n=1 Tax=Biomphalaria pfeifferi TaxID=112525 RepID=A0AAD8C9V5_BIOPF|nr:hypothetical protein Bpfe_001253 [Biomphalaria pfeifferi]
MNNQSSPGHFSDSIFVASKSFVYIPIIIFVVVLVELIVIVLLACRTKKESRAILRPAKKKSIIDRLTLRPRTALHSYIFPNRKTLVTFGVRRNITENTNTLQSSTENIINSESSSHKESNNETNVEGDVPTNETTLPVIHFVDSPAYTITDKDESDECISIKADACLSSGADSIYTDAENTAVVSSLLAEPNSIYCTISSLRGHNLIHSANKHLKYIPAEAHCNNQQEVPNSCEDQRNSEVYSEIGDSFVSIGTMLDSVKPQGISGTLPKCQIKSFQRKLNAQCWSNPCIPTISLHCNNRRSNVSDSHIYSEIPLAMNIKRTQEHSLENNSLREEVIQSLENCSFSQQDQTLEKVQLGLLNGVSACGNCSGEARDSVYDALANSSIEYNYEPFRSSSRSSHPRCSSPIYVEPDFFFTTTASDVEGQSSCTNQSREFSKHHSINEIMSYEKGKSSLMEELTEPDQEDYWEADGYKEDLPTLDNCETNKLTCFKSNCIQEKTNLLSSSLCDTSSKVDISDGDYVGLNDCISEC